MLSNFFLRFYLFQKGRESTSAQTEGGAKEKGDGISQADSKLSIEPDVGPGTGLNLITLRSWPELQPRVGRSTK